MLSLTMLMKSDIGHTNARTRTTTAVPRPPSRLLCLITLKPIRLLLSLHRALLRTRPNLPQARPRLRPLPPQDCRPLPHSNLLSLPRRRLPTLPALLPRPRKSFPLKTRPSSSHCFRSGTSRTGTTTSPTSSPTTTNRPNPNQGSTSYRHFSSTRDLPSDTTTADGNVETGTGSGSSLVLLPLLRFG